MDYTNAVGSKWKAFFEDLELNADLDIEQPAHIWLIHFLFLSHINTDIQTWANAWNNHKMQMPDIGTVSPAEIRYFNTLVDGVRGFPAGRDDWQAQDPPLAGREIDEYGIDWEAYRNTQIQHHFHTHNHVEQGGPFNPFTTAGPGHHPEHFSMVEVDEARCPFTEEGRQWFKAAIEANIPQDIRAAGDAQRRKQYFILALQIARSMT